MSDVDGPSGLVLALLAAGEAGARARRSGTNPGPWSLTLGLVLFPMGLLLYIGRGLSFAAGLGGGLRAFLTWHLHPECWLWVTYAGNGLLRVAGYLTLGEAVGDPLVWIGCRLAELLKGRRREGELRERFGPPRPDVAVTDPDGSPVVLSAREKPGWDEGVTVRIEERWFRLVRHEVRERSRRRVHAYVLEDLPPGEVIRGPVASDARLPSSLGEPPSDPAWDPYRS